MTYVPGAGTHLLCFLSEDALHRPHVVAGSAGCAIVPDKRHGDRSVAESNRSKFRVRCLKLRSKFLSQVLSRCRAPLGARCNAFPVAGSEPKHGFVVEPRATHPNRGATRHRPRATDVNICNYSRIGIGNWASVALSTDGMDSDQMLK
jgi:hypothetical protein